MSCLYKLSRLVLRVGGRLVFLFPVEHPQTFETVFPLQPDFAVISCCANSLSKDSSRLLVTLQRLEQSPTHLVTNSNSLAPIK